MLVTRGYHALALDFSLAIEDDALGHHLEWLLAGFPESSSPAYYVVGASEDDPQLVVLRQDAETVLQAADADSFATTLVTWINQQAIDPEYAVMVHAGGVARGRLACVLPADPESGKTTLTTGLVRAGYSYLTDEAVSFDWATAEIEPFPKPLSIDPGSQFLFPELRPRIRSARETSAQWQVPPASIRHDAAGGRCQAALVVFPRYDEDASTSLVPMTRAEGLIELAKNTFQFRERPRPALELLARVVRDVDCYRLHVGDLDTACAVVGELMDGLGDG